MRIDHKTLVENQNSVAHLDSLRQEIVLVSRALTDQQLKLKAENEAIRADSLKVTTDANKLMVLASQKLDDANLILEHIQEQERQVSGLVTSTQEELFKERQGHSVHLDKIKADISLHENYLFDIQTAIDVHLPIKDSMLKEVEQLTLTFKDLHGKIQELTDQYIKSKLEKETELLNLDKAIQLKKEEYVQVNQLVEAERQAIEGPRKLIEEENNKLEIKRRDIHIYEVRIRKLWTQLHPDQPMNVFEI